MHSGTVKALMRPDGAAAAGAAGVAVAAERIDAIARIYIEYLVSKAAVLLEAERRKEITEEICILALSHSQFRMGSRIEQENNRLRWFL